MGARPEVDAEETAVLSLADVEVICAGRRALAVPTLDVRPRETLAVIGPNGAGKSTLLRVLALPSRRAGGRVAYRGKPGDGRW